MSDKVAQCAIPGMAHNETFGAGANKWPLGTNAYKGWECAGVDL